MSKVIKTEILIEATPSEVWKVLTNTTAFPEWNPFVKSIKGELLEGNQISVQLPDMKFEPVVLEFKPNTKFSWQGKLWKKGIFDGLHSFQLDPVNNGLHTRFIHSELFSGVLTGLLLSLVGSKTTAGFEEMNKALKTRVEELKKDRLSPQSL